MTTVTAPSRLLRRPTAKTGIWSWVTTVDHKRIGILYGFTAFTFFILGGLEALLIRLQLAAPERARSSAPTLYNQLFTMHGTTMIFLVVMPMSAAFFNYFMPLQIGARDVAFPRLNAFSYWVFLFGGLFLILELPARRRARRRLVRLRPADHRRWRSSPGATDIDFWMPRPADPRRRLDGRRRSTSSSRSSTCGRPGMKLMRMPVFIWMTLVVNFLLLFAMPVITVALFCMMFDRTFGAIFFNPAAGGDPILWQHLFWLFGHPEVYILILPAMGIVSEIMPVFSRKPLFGYSSWCSPERHRLHGLGRVGAPHVHRRPGPGRRLGVRGVDDVHRRAHRRQDLQLAGHDVRAARCGSRRRCCSRIGFVAMFIIGGLSGIIHSMVPHDAQQHDTYYIVAHFHYVLFGGAIIGLFGGLYYWFPKMYGRMMNERLGKIHFWMMMHRLQHDLRPDPHPGPEGHAPPVLHLPGGSGLGDVEHALHRRRLPDRRLDAGLHAQLVEEQAQGRDRPGPTRGTPARWSGPFLHPRPSTTSRRSPSSPSATTSGTASTRRTRRAARSGSRRRSRAGRTRRKRARPGIHMPSPSYFPMIAALGFPVMAYAVILQSWFGVGVGVVICLAGFYGWVLEPARRRPHPP